MKKRHMGRPEPKLEGLGKRQDEANNNEQSLDYQPAVVNNGHTHGWFKAMRHPDLPELVRTNHNAYLVATIIAYRARWNPKAFNPHGLEMGEAIVDYANWGLSEGQFRRGLAALEKWGFATSRTTNRGTIARLVNTDLFCVVASQHKEQTDEPTTDQTTSQPKAQPKAQPKTNEEQRAKSKERKSKEPPSFDDDDVGLRAKVTSKQFGPKASKPEFLKFAHSLGINGESEELWNHFVEVDWRDANGKPILSPIPYLRHCAEYPREWEQSPPSKGAKGKLTRVPITGGAR